MSEHVALDWLLAERGYEREIDGRPSECCHCPFATAEVRLHDEPNPADPGEGHYECALLDRTGRDAVWGEEPVCSSEDWRAKARDELGQEVPA